MPKAELHVHLEGSIRPSTLLRLAARRGIDLPADSEEGLQEWFKFRDFDEFLEVYLTISRCLRDPEDFQLAARAFLEERARENILYTEAHLTISTHMANGAPADEVADALADTVRDGERDLGVTLRWIPDIVRNVDYGRADQTLEWALENRERYVVALGLSGKESYPSQPFAEHFEVAAAEGLHRTVHAGEQTGAAAIWDALELCGAQRIGHGIRAVEDPSLLAALAERCVPLEVSPTSNVALGMVPFWEEHPLPELAAAGVLWSVNSDDPALFDVNLADEYLRVAELMELDASGLAGLSTTALGQAFVTGEERATLEKRFSDWFEDAGVEPLAAP